MLSIAQTAPDLGDTLNQAVIRHRCSVPNGVEKRSLRDNLTIVAEKMSQHIGGLAAQSDERPIAAF